MGTSQVQQWAEEMLEGCPPTQPGHTLPPCVSAHRQLGSPGPCCSCLLSFSDPSFQSFISQAPSDYTTGWPEVKSWFPWFMPLHSLLQSYHHLLRVQLYTTYPQIPSPLGTSCCFLNFHIVSGISGWSHMTELATVEMTLVSKELPLDLYVCSVQSSRFCAFLPSAFTMHQRLEIHENPASSAPVGRHRRVLQFTSFLYHHHRSET